MKTVLLAIISILTLQLGHATTIVVANHNDAGPGSFRAAVANAVDGDTIRFNPALLANGSDTIKFTSSVSIFKKVVIKGLFSATDTLFFSGQNATRILVVDIAMSALGTKNIVLDSLALIDGNVGTQQGGCMYIGPGLDTLFLRNSVIRNGQAKFGGGIYCGTTTLSTAKPPLVIISDSKFQNNTSTDYGGAYCSYFAELKTNNVRVTGNSSERGGGFYFHAEGVSELSNTLVYNNSATHSGGGFNTHFTDTVIISNSKFEGNTASNFGGGMYSSGKLDVRKTEVKQNEANTRGGGIYFGYYASTMIIDSCEVSENSASFGAGVYSQSALNVSHSNFRNNVGGQGAGMYFTSAVIHVLGCTFSGNSGSTGGGIYSGQLATLHVNKSTIANNSASLGGGIYCYTPYSANSFSITNSTVVNNTAIFGGGVGLRTSATYPLNATFKSSVIADNGTENIRAFNDTITSLGYNIFGDSVVVGSIATDQLAVSDSLLSFRPLGNYGGFTHTAPPNKGSVAVNAGNPLDVTSAQNKAIAGVRDAGAAELVGVYRDTITACTQTTWYGMVYSVSGDYVKLLPNADTVATLNLTIIPFTTGVDVVSTCTSYTWTNGVTYSSSNFTATDTLVNSIGCDSIVTLNLTFIPPANGIDIVTACESFTWINGVTYTASNNAATDTLTNVMGCDSIVTLNLTINQPSSGVDVFYSCDPVIWIDGVTYTTTNNTATDTLLNALGCDSIVTLNLVILSGSTGTDIILACDNYTWIDGITYTFNNNTATDTLVNAAGCDSIVTLDLTIHSTNVSVTVTAPSITANTASASYQWLDCTNNFAIIPGQTAQVFTATANGSYAVEITELGCVDTSVCTTISNIGIAKNNSGRMHVYPNPAHEVLHIANLWPNEVKRILLANALGQEVFILETNEAAVQIDTRKLNAGIYILYVTTGSKNLTESVIISK